MEQAAFEEETQAFCNNLLLRLGSHPRDGRMLCRIIAGRVNTGISTIPESCNSVVSARKVLFYSKDKEMVIDEQVQEDFFTVMPGSVFQGYIDRLRENLISSAGSKASDCLQSWVDEVSGNYRPLPEDVKIMASLLSTCIPDSILFSPEGTGDPGTFGSIPLQQWMKKEIEAARHMDDICRTFNLAADYLRKNIKNNGVCVRAEIRKALEYIHENYAGDISLETVAEHVKLSASWFGSLFRNEMRQTFSDYLASYRIAAAKKLLEQTDMPVSRIAEETGISDPHYFSRLFARITGQSPKEYRNGFRA